MASAAEPCRAFPNLQRRRCVGTSRIAAPTLRFVVHPLTCCFGSGRADRRISVPDFLGKLLTWVRQGGGTLNESATQRQGKTMKRQARIRHTALLTIGLMLAAVAVAPRSDATQYWGPKTLYWSGANRASGYGASYWYYGLGTQPIHHDLTYSDINQDGYSTYSNAVAWQFWSGVGWVSIGKANHPNITSGTWNGWASFGTTGYAGEYRTSGNVCLHVPWQSDPCVGSGRIGF